jgi:acyl-CoA dehydrogenase
MVLRTRLAIEQHGFEGRARQISLIKFHVAGVMQRGARPRDPGPRRARHHRRHACWRWFYAHERGARIYDGPDEVHKMVVARRILHDTLRRKGGHAGARE